MVTWNNAINARQQGTQYQSSSGAWSGVDASTAGFVLTSNGTGVSPTFQSAAGGTYYSLTPYIVGSDAHSQYSTIQTAIDQAVIDGASNTVLKVIYIKPGIYTENLTVPAGIVLYGTSAANPFSANQTMPVILVGHILFDNSAADIQNAQVLNMEISSAASYCVHFTTPVSSFAGIVFTNVLFNAAYFFNTQSFSISVQLYACYLNITSNLSATASAGISYIEGWDCIVILPTITISGSYSFDLTFLKCHITSSLGGVTGTTSGVLSVNFEAEHDRSYSLGISNPIDVVCSQFYFTAIGLDLFLAGGVTISPVGTNTLFLQDCFINPVDGQTFISDIFTTFGSSTTILNTEIQDALPDVINKYGSYNLSGTPVAFNYSEVCEVQSYVQTTNATVTTIASIPIKANQSIIVSGTVIGQNSTFTDTTSSLILATAHNTAGTVATVGVPVVTPLSTSTGLVTISVSGANLLIRVTGILATTYNWTCNLTYQGIINQS